jgi:hypothetical protein
MLCLRTTLHAAISPQCAAGEARCHAVSRIRMQYRSRATIGRSTLTTRHERAHGRVCEPRHFLPVGNHSAAGDDC